jgi:D-glycero-D-manno-heptose 1,7-bisphosphate phosphatase
MVIRAATEMGVDLRSSYLIGDRWRDVDCAHAAGCQAIFIDRGYKERLRQAPNFTVTSLAEAADVVLCDARTALHSSRR